VPVTSHRDKLIRGIANEIHKSFVCLNPANKQDHKPTRNARYVKIQF
jgi:hypothetical protein